MPWGVAAAVAGAAVSSGIGAMTKSGGGSTSRGTSENAPWGPQQDYMTQGYKQAESILQDRMPSQLPQGPWTAGQNATQTAALAGLNHAGGTAPETFAPWTAAGATLAGGAGTFRDNATRMASDGIGSNDPNISNLMKQYALTGTMPGSSQVDQGLQGGITGAATQGLGSLGQGQAMANLVGAQALDPNAGMNATIQGATNYANNAGLDGQIDAASRDVVRQLGEDTVRGIHQGAMTSGNANSSRAGALEGIADRGAADRIADISASMRGAAYNQGGQLASAQYQNGLQTALGSASTLNNNGGIAGGLASGELNRQTGQNQFDVTSRLGSGSSANSSDLGWATGNATARIAGNGQLGQGLGYGMDASKTGLAGTLEGLQAQLAAGGYQQAQDQAVISDNLNRWNVQDQRQQSILNDYWNIVGRPDGSSGSTTSTPAPGSTAQNILGGASAGYGLYKNNPEIGNTVRGWFSSDSSGYDPGQYGYNGNAGSSGGQALQNMGFYTPLPT